MTFGANPTATYGAFSQYPESFGPGRYGPGSYGAGGSAAAPPAARPAAAHPWAAEDTCDWSQVSDVLNRMPQDRRAREGLTYQGLRGALDAKLVGLDEPKAVLAATLVTRARLKEDRFSLVLQGPSGTGKTSLVRAAAAAAGRALIYIDLNRHGFDANHLIGFHDNWKAPQAGLFLREYVRAGATNPLVFFDEVDKALAGPCGQQLGGWIAGLQSSTRYDDPFLKAPLSTAGFAFVYAVNDLSKMTLGRDWLRSRCGLTLSVVGSREHTRSVVLHHIIPDRVNQAMRLQPNTYDVPADTFAWSDSAVDLLLDAHTNRHGQVTNIRSIATWFDRLLDLWSAQQQDGAVDETWLMTWLPVLDAPFTMGDIAATASASAQAVDAAAATLEPSFASDVGGYLVSNSHGGWSN